MGRDACDHKACKIAEGITIAIVLFFIISMMNYI